MFHFSWFFSNFTKKLRVNETFFSNFKLCAWNFEFSREKSPLWEKANGRQAVKLIVVVTLMFLQVSLLSTLLASCSAFAFQAINWSFAIPARRTRRAEADNQETKHFQQQMHVSHTGWTSKGASVTFKIPKGNSIFEKTLENPFFPHGFSYKVNLWKKKYGKFVKGTAFDFRKPLGRKYSNVDGF